MHKVTEMTKRIGCIFLGLSAILFLAPPGVKADYPRTDEDTPVTRKVLVLNYNPIFEAYGNKTAIQYFGFSDPHALTNQFIAAIQQGSGGAPNAMLNYQIVEWRDIDDIPIKRDGFDYTDASYIACNNSNGAACHIDSNSTYTDQYGQIERIDYANYHTIITSQNICPLVDSGAIDEVWMWGGGWFGFYEARMAGPGSVYTNGQVLMGPTCSRAIHFMGFNYSSPFDNMMESFMHRVEGAVNAAYGAGGVGNPGSVFNLAIPSHAFFVYEAKAPNLARCGTAHMPPNSPNLQEYIYYNYATGKRTMCEDYWNYPYLIYPVNTWYHIRGCEQWGCTKGGYDVWWLDRLPRYKGRTEGHWDNWWKYVIDPASAAAVPPTAEPRGTLDGYLPGSNCTVVGWTCDWSNYSQPLTVEFYEGWVKRGEVVANAWREDAVATLCGGQRYHGFTYKFPANSGMYSGGNRYIYARAKDINNSSQQTGLLWTLSYSPRAIYCNTSY